MQLALFALARTIFNTAYRMIYPFLGVFSRALGVDIATLSLALGTRSLAGVIVPFFAPLADKKGRKFGMLLGLGLFTFSMALIILSPTFQSLAIALFTSALAKHIFDPAMQAYLADHTPYQKRGLVIAITELGWSFAFFIGVPIMGFMIGKNGWIAPFPLLAGMGFIIFLLIFALIPANGTRVQQPAGLRTNFWRIFRHPPAIAGLTLTFLIVLGNELVNIVFGVWLEDSFGLQIAALGASAAVIGVAELGGEGFVALFSDKLGKKRAVILGLATNSLAALMLPSLGTSEIGAFIGLFLFYISFEFTFVTALPMMTELLPSARATLMSFNVAAFSIGRAVGAPLSGYLYHFSFSAVILGTVFSNILGFMALSQLNENEIAQNE